MKQKLWKCRVTGCSYAATNLTLMSRHKRRSHVVKWKRLIFKCVHCNRIFVRESKYKHHMKMKHPTIKPLNQPGSAIRHCKVRDCCHLILNDTQLKQHALDHHPAEKTTWIRYAKANENVDDSGVTRSAMNKMSLEQIMQQYHLPLSNVSCNRCDFVTNSVIDYCMHCLNSHWKLENVYKCRARKWCRKKFNGIADLLFHVKSTHKENYFLCHYEIATEVKLEIYSCAPCKLGFLNKSEFIIHTKNNHASWLYQGIVCRRCYKKIANSSSLTENRMNYCPVSLFSCKNTMQSCFHPPIQPMGYRLLTVYTCKCNNYRTLVESRFKKHINQCTG